MPLSPNRYAEGAGPIGTHIEPVQSAFVPLEDKQVSAPSRTSLKLARIPLEGRIAGLREPPEYGRVYAAPPMVDGADVTFVQSPSGAVTIVAQGSALVGSVLDPQLVTYGACMVHDDTGIHAGEVIQYMKGPVPEGVCPATLRYAEDGTPTNLTSVILHGSAALPTAAGTYFLPRRRAGVLELMDFGISSNGGVPGIMPFTGYAIWESAANEPLAYVRVQQVNLDYGWTVGYTEGLLNGYLPGLVIDDTVARYVNDRYSFLDLGISYFGAIGPRSPGHLGVLVAYDDGALAYSSLTDTDQAAPGIGHRLGGYLSTQATPTGSEVLRVTADGMVDRVGVVNGEVALTAVGKLALEDGETAIGAYERAGKLYAVTLHPPATPLELRELRIYEATGANSEHSVPLHPASSVAIRRLSGLTAAFEICGPTGPAPADGSWTVQGEPATIFASRDDGRCFSVIPQPTAASHALPIGQFTPAAYGEGDVPGVGRVRVGAVLTSLDPGSMPLAPTPAGFISTAARLSPREETIADALRAWIRRDGHTAHPLPTRFQIPRLSPHCGDN